MAFNARSGDMLERCADDIARYVSDHGEPWFARFRSPRSLLESADSPLDASARALLAAALAGSPAPENVALSRQLLGLAGA